MYPNLFYAFKELFGIEWPFLKAIHSVGFFMALAFIPGAWLWSHELKRKEKNHELTYRTDSILYGGNVNYAVVVLNSLLGFIACYKLTGIFFAGNVQDIQGYILSSNGNIIAGLLGGLIWGGTTWYAAYKLRMPVPEKRTVKIYPHEYVPRAILVAALSGVAGSKLAGILESPGQFIQSPIKTIFSGTGFAFLGGLIIATFAMWFYHYKFGVQRMRMADALAPSLMLSYCLGRLGCHIGGDGDWGINNLNPKPFAWLPDWLWAWDYPHNVIRTGNYIPGCRWDDYCTQLAIPVYPTPLYELLMGMILFAIMMLLRKRLKRAGQMSALYLVFAGLERFLIEQIRIDVKYSLQGWRFTQAEMLSVVLVVAGVVLWRVMPVLNANKFQPVHKDIRIGDYAAEQVKDLQD